MTPGSLESASLTTWTTHLTAVESHAGERDKFATDLVVQVAEPLKQVAMQYEEIRKCHVDFHAKLEKERESSYSELKKAKGKYDGACQEVEGRRKKMEGSFDHNKPKAQAAYQQQILEMNNVKVGSVLPSTRPPLTEAEYVSDQYKRNQQTEGTILP
jgi:Skp family chaperone for outer membrane proteins